MHCLHTFPLQRFNLYMREKFRYLRHQRGIIHRTLHFIPKIKSRLKNNVYYHFITGEFVFLLVILIMYEINSGVCRLVLWRQWVRFCAIRRLYRALKIIMRQCSKNKPLECSELLPSHV